MQAAAGHRAHVLLETRQHLLQTRLLQVVLDKTLRPVPGRHRRVRPGDARQGPRVPRRVLRVLRVRRGAVQGRLLRRAGRRGLLPAGLRAAPAQGRARAGAHVQPAQGRGPPLAVRAQGQAAEEEERAAAVAARVQRARRAQRAEDTAVDTGSHASHRSVFFDGVADLRDVQLVLAHELVDYGHRRRRRRHVAPATAAGSHQAHAHVVQTPPAAHDEVVLQHQPEPGRQRPEAAGAKDRPVQTSVTGLVPKRQSEVEKEHHETGEQPSDDQFHGEPEPEHAVRSRSDQRAHAGLAGSELCRPVLSPTCRFPIVAASDLTRRDGRARRTTTRIVHNYVNITNFVRCFILSHNQIYPSVLPASPPPRRGKCEPLPLPRATSFVPMATVLKILYLHIM